MNQPTRIGLAIFRVIVRFGPFLRFGLDEGLVFVRAAAAHGEAARGEVLMDVRALEGNVHFLVERVHDGRRCAGGREHALP
jgi:hypothetical protein